MEIRRGTGGMEWSAKYFWRPSAMAMTSVTRSRGSMMPTDCNVARECNAGGLEPHGTSGTSGTSGTRVLTCTSRKWKTKRMRSFSSTFRAESKPAVATPAQPRTHPITHTRTQARSPTSAVTVRPACSCAHYRCVEPQGTYALACTDVWRASDL